ncbi:MAG: peptide ABC transporter substrate-binding protein [Chloroflexi bacterium]|nr:peptide ABC transporter substrate-binding protein [Chloroflexota bacterium]
MFKRATWILLVLALAGLLVAPAAAQGGKIVTVIYDQEPDNLNTLYSNMFFMGITDELYLPGAWSYDKELNLVPELAVEIPSAENGGFNADGTVMTFQVRQDAFWSDGDQITAADFVFTYEMTMAPTNSPASRSPFDTNVVSVTAPDEFTVVTTFNAPYAPWAANLWGFVLPEHVLRPVFEAEGTIDNAEWNTNPTVSGGPFILTQWEAGQFMLFSRNDSYFGGAPLLDNVLIRFAGDSAALTASLANGEADMATFIPLSDAQMLEASGNLTLELVPSGYNESWYFNQRPGLGNPALQDVRVRRALIMAFDRDQVNLDLNAGLLTTPGSFWENTPFANPDIDALPYDPDMARQLLTEAGWIDDDGDEANVANDPTFIPTPRVAQGIEGIADGSNLSLRYATTQRQIRIDTQAVAQQALARVGVIVELFNYPGDVYFGTVAEGGILSTGQYDIAQLSINPAFPDPDTTRFICSEIPTDTEDGANDAGVCTPELDALFTQQAQTVDTAARIAIFHQIDAILHDLAIWNGIWTDPDVWVYNNRVLGLELTGPNPFWNAHEWDVAQ